MTSSDSKARPEKVLDTLLDALSQDRVSAEVDEWIDHAVSSFEFPTKDPESQQAFLDILGRFVAHVYKHGLSLPQALNPSQARAEALRLLEEGYMGQHASGYGAALLDALTTRQAGVSVVLHSLGEILKELERRKYAQWVFTSHVDPLDWHATCRLVEVVLERCQPYLPPGILDCPPAQLVDDYPYLVADHIRTNGLFMAVDSGPNTAIRRQKQRQSDTGGLSN